ncbi:hypothetical protein BH23GEM3_BH23GEM3_15710 [soil metagenome]
MIGGSRVAIIAVLWLLGSGLVMSAGVVDLYGQDPIPAAQTPPRAARDTVPAGDTVQVAQRQREAAGSDSIYQALLRLEGYTPMEYQGDSATFRARDRVLRLYGPAEVARAGDRLTARDTIIYREETRFVEAYGEPSISGQSERIEGNVMFYDLATRRATIQGGRTRVAEAGASWLVRGDVTAEGTDRIYATRSIFTTDEREEPAYYFQADDIKVIRDRILVGRPARLYFRNVPVFWLPFIAQDLTRGRRSGLLPPDFSINDIVRTSSSGRFERGTGRQISNVGFYWALNEYMDAQLSGAWRSGDYTSMRGAMQYRWRSQFLDGRFSYQQFWRETGSSELQFFTNNSWRPNERTNVALNANFLSSRFLREISTDPLQTTQNIGSSFTLNRRFDWGSVDLGANRQQMIANDRVEMTLPTIGINPQPITLFRSATPDQARWYNNATLSFSGRGSRSEVSFGEGIPRSVAQRGVQRDVQRSEVQVNQSFSVGNIRMSSNFGLNRSLQPEVPPLNEFEALPRLDDDRGSWSTSLGYQINLIGATSLSPTAQFSQDLRRDTLTGGSYLGGPMRTSIGASLRTDLFGFYPGIGGFSAIRHRLSPSLSYSYVPEAELTDLQRRVFGERARFAQNNITLSFNQTWEARLRSAEANRPPRDTLADTLGAEPPAASAPAEDRKVTLLTLNTTPLNYDFVRAARGESGFTTLQVTNTVASDYLRGLQFTMSHDLFARPDTVPPGAFEPDRDLGRFSPRLTALSTQFSFGAGAPLLRYLGLGQRRPDAPAATDSIPAEPQPEYPIDHTRRNATLTSNPQAAGRGPWNVDVGYTLYRPRGGEIPAQDIRLGMTFSPTANWGVNWYTNYSVEDARFVGHRLTLRRDLYRWEANFNFSRTPYGNTSFDVLVRLKDLPDLKVDYRESNIGATRPQ